MSKFTDMKTFKKIDCWINLLLIGFFLVYSFIKLDHSFLYGYCIVGSWQIISMLVHAYKGYFVSKYHARYYYQAIIMILLASLLIGWIIYPVAFAILFALLFTAPALAVIYSVICYKELTIKMKRPLHDLK